ncbi:type II toxin-antitoxin system HicA family toxin [Paracraurococcus lichenis]|uniref:Type II toxin-antitoxin system HicA family toxin n=1 Tax=Paracraurococcus lichenis TaxID=3064888 RepID=A0ABT9E8D1_9PROT|nr:type II toxin-antitoxin system HicA family toxin [Paracraurococcus sp. LOR1-02]MDO9712466.1 type II toxin-antitoxin system HicA family toxin [Paracraurococcus sp. LOR1-02]
MSDYPDMNGIELLRTIRRLANRRGLVLVERPGKGSHIVVTLSGRRSTIPQHRADLPMGTYRAILRHLGLTDDDLKE